MDIIIQSLDFTAGETLESYVKEKVQKLEQMDDRIMRARVTLKLGQEASDNHHCDIRLEVPGNDHFVQRRAGSFEAAVVDAVDNLQKQIRRNKD